jgi:hypothetical protein
MVVTFAPSTWEMGNMHERTARSFTSTVHAPQAEIPHPNFVPVKPSVSRSAHKSGVSGSMSSV